MSDDYPRCVNCGARIERINFALGAEWRHWPTPHGNYRTAKKYRHCKSSAVAAPIPESEEQR